MIPFMTFSFANWDRDDQLGTTSAGIERFRRDSKDGSKLAPMRSIVTPWQRVERVFRHPPVCGDGDACGQPQSFASLEGFER